jgi:hypothetical protein
MHLNIRVSTVIAPIRSNRSVVVFLKGSLQFRVGLEFHFKGEHSLRRFFHLADRLLLARGICAEQENHDDVELQHGLKRSLEGVRSMMLQMVRHVHSSRPEKGRRSTLPTPAPEPAQTRAGALVYSRASRRFAASPHDCTATSLTWSTWRTANAMAADTTLKFRMCLRHCAWC